MGKRSKKESCPFCGSEIVSCRRTEELSCVYCGEREAAATTCKNSHLVCTRCQDRDPRSVVQEFAMNTGLKDMAAIAEWMMGHPRLGMLDCDHAFIASGALMAALKNSPYGNKITNDQITEVFERTASQVALESCARTGVCSIVPAIGACVSLFLGVQFGADREQQILMDSVTKVSRILTDMAGPVCCKAYVRASLNAATSIFAERFGMMLPVSLIAPVCRSSEKHPFGCCEERCPYYRNDPSADIFAESIYLKPTTCHS